jgi:hypothetical protein
MTSRNLESSMSRCLSGGLAATEATELEPRSGANHSGALLCAGSPNSAAAAPGKSPTGPEALDGTSRGGVAAHPIR